MWLNCIYYMDTIDEYVDHESWKLISVFRVKEKLMEILNEDREFTGDDTEKVLDLSRRMRKPTICIRENKGTDQLCSNCKADHRLCFRYTDSTIPLLLVFKISSF